MLDILYQDAEIIAINKPHGLLVHQSSIARDADVFALQLLRDQLHQKVYPAHRLDRKTGGILLFSLTKEMDRALQSLFQNRKMDKSYLAIVRGFTQDSGEIDYPLKKDDGEEQDALTLFRTLSQVEVDIPSGKFETSRYSLVEAIPETGRMHQLRKHFAHIFHPILGDRPHGCNKQNKLWKDRFGMDTMMLHASRLAFIHPNSGQQVTIEAPLLPEFERVISILKFPK